MTSDPEIFRAAKLPIDQHRADAGLHAAERADALPKAGDTIGAMTWRHILRSIEEFGRGSREGEPINQGVNSQTCR
jgi:hypothetical protein